MQCFRFFLKLYRHSFKAVFILWPQTLFFLTLLLPRPPFPSLQSSVADPDPPDPHVFGPPGSPSKNSKKNLDSYCFVTSFRLFVFENNVNAPLKSSTPVSKKTFLKKIIFLLASWRSMTKIAGSGSASGSGSITQRHGSADPDPDPDPHQNVMDPQHCFKEHLSMQDEQRGEWYSWVRLQRLCRQSAWPRIFRLGQGETPTPPP